MTACDQPYFTLFNNGSLGQKSVLSLPVDRQIVAFCVVESVPHDMHRLLVELSECLWSDGVMEMIRDVEKHGEKRKSFA